MFDARWQRLVFAAPIVLAALYSALQLADPRALVRSSRTRDPVFDLFHLCMAIGMFVMLVVALAPFEAAGLLGWAPKEGRLNV